MTIQFRNLNGQAEQTVWRPIDLGEHGGFEVELRRPRFGELTADGERFSGYVEERIKTALVGWRGVEDDGEPVAFSWDNFTAFCVACPAIFQHVARHVAGLYAGMSEDAEKNSDRPS